jgi:hypothetical protein
VIDAALQAAIKGAPHVAHRDLLESVERVKASRINRDQEVVVHDLTDDEAQVVERSLGNGT